MSDFNVRSDSVDVEQIMEQIRARIREKRGVDYTEQQLRELAAVKLEKFLDPRGVRSDLLQRFKERQPQYEKPLLPLYTFEDTTIYETHRGPLQWIRKMLQPMLKLLFNPNPIIHALHAQAEINALEPRARRGAGQTPDGNGVALLRDHPQPRVRADALRHRGQEPEDARRIAREPARVQRAAGPGARKRRRLQAGGRPASRIS